MTPSMSGYRKIIRYCYYRCRSHAGGRPPCRGVSVPAGQIEEYVLGLLADPRNWVAADPPQSTLEADVQDRFDAWSALNDSDKRKLLPIVVQRVDYCIRKSTISLSWTPQAFDPPSQGLNDP